MARTSIFKASSNPDSALENLDFEIVVIECVKARIIILDLYRVNAHQSTNIPLVEHRKHSSTQDVRNSGRFQGEDKQGNGKD